MVHNSKVQLRHQQLVARRREHTLVKHSTLALAQMLVWLPPLLQAVNLPQPQAHSDTQVNKHSSLPTVCHSSQYTVSRAT
jgi:hypothetical protein